MSEITATAPEEQYELKDTIGVKRFTGRLIAQVSTDNGKGNRRPARWSDFALYVVTKGDKTGSYVLEIVGCSDVYHDVNGKCTFGQRTNSKQLPDTAVPCRECNPATKDGSALDDYVSMETDRAQVYVCDGPQDVLNHLKDKMTHKVSAPSVALLQEAAVVDAGIRSLTETVEDI